MLSRYISKMVTRNKDNIVNLAERRESRLETSDQVLERLFYEHREALRTFIRRRATPEDEPEDILQEVFARLANLGDLNTRIQADKGDGRSYLFTMANNLIVDQERRKKLQRQYDASQNAEHWVTESGPETIVTARDELEHIKRVILNLRPNWRQAFVLNRFHAMSYRQVAEHMGVTVKQIESYMAQALVKIREAEESRSFAGESSKEMHDE